MMLIDIVSILIGIYGIVACHERIVHHTTSPLTKMVGTVSVIGVYLFSNSVNILNLPLIGCLLALIGIVAGVLIEGPITSIIQWKHHRDQQRRRQRYLEAQEQAKIDAMRIRPSQNRVVGQFHVPDREQQLNDAEHIARRFRD